MDRNQDNMSEIVPPFAHAEWQQKIADEHSGIAMAGLNHVICRGDVDVCIEHAKEYKERHPYEVVRVYVELSRYITEINKPKPERFIKFPKVELRDALITIFCFAEGIPFPHPENKEALYVSLKRYLTSGKQYKHWKMKL